MPGFLRQQLDHILHRSRSHSRNREPAQTATTTTSAPHHIVEFVKSADGLTYIAPPYMVGVPVSQSDPNHKSIPTTTEVVTDAPAPNPIPLQPSRLFANPVITGSNAEPSIVRVGKEYFLTTASGPLFPGLPIYRSVDLVNWELVSHGLGRKDQWGFGESVRLVGEEEKKKEGDEEILVEGIRAPSLRERNGTFYLVACWCDGKIESSPQAFYVQSNNILDDAAWSDPIFFDNQGLGQDLFWDNDGKAYLITMDSDSQPPTKYINHSTISISEVDLATGKSLTKSTIVQSYQSALSGVSRLIKRENIYYLFSTKLTGSSFHEGCVSRSDQGPFGSWEPAPQNPLWRNGLDEEIQNISHTDIFEDAEGKWWAVLSGTRPTKVDGKWIDSVLGSETLLVTADWDDGWPVFNGGKSISLVTTSHSDKLKKRGPLTWYSDFHKGELEIGWYQPYPFTPSPCYTLPPSARNIRIHGNAYNLSSFETPALLTRKQTAFRQAWKVLLTFKPSRRGSEAGIVVWINQFAYCALGVHLAEDGEKEDKVGVRVVSLTGPGGEGGIQRKVVQNLPKYDCTVGLDVEAKDDGYYFSVSTQKDYDYVVASVSCQALMKSAATAPSSTSSSTGAMFGLYAFTDEESCSDVADFGNVLVVNTDRS